MQPYSVRGREMLDARCKFSLLTGGGKQREAGKGVEKRDEGNGGRGVRGESFECVRWEAAVGCGYKCVFRWDVIMSKHLLLLRVALMRLENGRLNCGNKNAAFKKNATFRALNFCLAINKLEKFGGSTDFWRKPSSKLASSDSQCIFSLKKAWELISLLFYRTKLDL